MEFTEKNIFAFGFIPLRVTHNQMTVWKNRNPNSPFSFRPLFLIRKKETDTEMINLVIPTTDKARCQLCEEGITIDFVGTRVHVILDIIDSMKDLKFKKNLSELLGADCLLCKTRQCDWKDTAQILKGFPISRTGPGTMDLFFLLGKNTEGKIIKKKKMIGRKETGLCEKPASTSDQKHITVLDSKTNTAKWYLKIIVRTRVEFWEWPESKGI